MVVTKISGITNCNDAQEAAKLADIIGITVNLNTPNRFVSKEQAIQITRDLGNQTAVSAPPVNIDYLQNIIDETHAGYVEIHNHFKPESIKRIKNAQVIKTIYVKNKTLEQTLQEIQEFSGCYQILNLDPCVQRCNQVDWNTIKQIRDAIYPQKVMLSGPFTEETVPKVIKKVRPYGIDVSKGVERRPGKKSFEKMRHFTGIVKRFKYQ